MIKFIFDLDGTITSQETLPLIARHFGIEEEIEELTRETINGNIPFAESFSKRVRILGALPVAEVSGLLSTVPIYPAVMEFIQSNSDNCIIATGNLLCWVDKLVQRIGCDCYSSDAIIENGKVAKLTKIVQKEHVVEKYQKMGAKVVFVGDGDNDAEAMRIADVSIASGLTHYPAGSVLAVSDHLVFTEEALCRQLNQWC